MLPESHFRRPSARLMLSLSSVALLSACGGGGETDFDYSAFLPDFAAPAPVLSSVLTASFLGIAGVTAQEVSLRLQRPEYRNAGATLPWLRDYIDQGVPLGASNEPLRSSGAAFAHEAGLTGSGQVIAFSDGHISPSHEALGGRVTLLTGNAPDVICDPACRDDEHATSVTSVALGLSPTFVGIAPGATGIYGYFGAGNDRGTLIDLGQLAIAFESVAWNNSWGFSNLYVNDTGFDGAFAGADGQFYLATLSQYAVARTDTKDEGVVVFAVSNNDNGNAGIMDGLPFLRHEFEAGWIAVANGVPTLSGSDVTSVYLLSSPCYQSARWCIIGDGSWTAAVGGGSAYEETTGSSFAAPQVSGALALLAEAFPSLSPHQLRIRLLASADNTFSGFSADDTVELATDVFKGYSIIYGHGFLDIEAALRPIGGTTLSLREGQSLSTNAPVLLTGSGFGDAIETSLSGTSVAVRDALNAGFAMPGEALTAGAMPGNQGGILLAKSLRTNLAADRTVAPGALSDPFASFSGPVLTMTAPDGSASASVLVPDSGAGGLGVTITRVLTEGATKLELGLKLARDDGQILSLGGENAASMASVSLGLTQDLGGNAFLAVSGEMGVTDLGGATALTSATTARFDALKLTIGQGAVFANGDRISIGVGTPMAVASGSTVIDLPVYREGAAMSFEAVDVGLAPKERQLDLEMTYQAALSEMVEMKLSLVHSDNFGNRAGLSDTAGAIAFAFKF